MATAIPANKEAVEQFKQAAQKLFNVISGFWLSRAVQLAATLGIADELAAGPKTVEALARSTGQHVRSLQRLLRALSGFELFRELPSGEFALTEMSHFLRTDVVGSLRSTMMVELGMYHYDSWRELGDAVQSGGIAFDRKYGMNAWQFMQQTPTWGRLFNSSMVHITEAMQSAIVSAFDFTPYKKIVDIGGGRGQLLQAMLDASGGSAQGVLFDRAQVIEEARAEHRDQRMELVPGDFFESVTPDADLYTMKWIIHDWADEPATKILRNVRQAMKPNAHVLIIDSVLPEANEPSLSALFDLNMMVMTGGCERRASEFADLLANSGLRLVKIHATESPMSIVEAVAA